MRVVLLEVLVVVLQSFNSTRLASTKSPNCRAPVTLTFILFFSFEQLPPAKVVVGSVWMS